MPASIHLTVAAVIEQDGKFLCVEEHADGTLRLNQPAGHLEPGESIIDGAVRETLEETAYDFVPVSLLGIYRWRHPRKGVTYVRVAFTGTVNGPRPGYPLDQGIERAVWLSPEALRAERARHRSPLVLRCVEDHLAGCRHPLALLHELEVDGR